MNPRFDLYCSGPHVKAEEFSAGFPMINMAGIAKNLSKNPIGIVALFLVLIYGFAAFLLGTSNNTLTEAQRWPLVWFLVLFPPLLLGAFIYLVVFHHEKLYAPSEFRNENYFFKKLGPDEQSARLAEEVKHLEVSAARPPDSTISDFRPLNREEVLLRVSLAEDLVIRALEGEMKTSVSREVAVRAGDSWINFDGAVVKGDELVAIEVKHVRGGEIALFRIEHLLDLLSNKSFDRFRRVSLVLAIVSDDTDVQDRQLRDRIGKVVEGFGVPVRVQFFKLDQLKRQFGLGA